MGRRESVSGGRPVVLTVKLSKAEEALLDGTRRGGESRSDTLRIGLDLLSRVRAREAHLSRPHEGGPDQD